ncbi:hypothetical protein LXL04_007876 [Taraxacum kok-saghyz]
MNYGYDLIQSSVVSSPASHLRAPGISASGVLVSPQVYRSKLQSASTSSRLKRLYLSNLQSATEPPPPQSSPATTRGPQATCNYHMTTGNVSMSIYESKFVHNTRPRNTSYKPRPRNHEPFDGDEDCLNSHLIDRKRHRGMKKPSQQNLKNTNLQNMVYNGMTQIGYEKTHTDYSFDTDQSDVSLYMTAIASFSHLVKKKPSIKVFPDTGLAVTLSGSGAIGTPPTTLSPTLLDINWRCEKTRNDPYEVQITIRVEGYDPIQFTLTKMCGSTQNKGGSSTEEGSRNSQ